MGPKISVILVNLNGAKYLRQCIQSIVAQEYDNLELIVVDGASTDGSLEIFESFKDRIKFFVSEPDDGPYYAVQKGFNLSTGEVMAWINSDDMYMPYSFQAVAEIFSENKNVNWLTGFAKEFNGSGSVVGRIALPWSRWSKRRFLSGDYQFIQQESTFWRRELWNEAGAKLDIEYKYAADMELWSRFFLHEKLYTTVTELAGFRHNSDLQRSKLFRLQYIDECERALSTMRQVGGSPFEILLLKISRWIFSPFFFLELPLLSTLYEWIFRIPKIIYYDFDTDKFSFESNRVRFPSFTFFGKQVTLKSFSWK